MYKYICIYIIIIVLLTLIYSLSTSEIAMHTFGTMTDIDCLDISNKYDRLIKKLPVAKNRTVTASLSCTGISSLMFVSSYIIICPIKHFFFSKSTLYILKKLRNDP